MQRIYVITNVLDGKQYVGQTGKPISERMYEHGSTWSYCTYMKNAIRKYGYDSFEIKEVATANSIDDANVLEKEWIESLGCRVPNGYNLKAGGRRSAVHEETKLKISLANKGKKKPPRSAEHSRKISLWHMGRKASEETKKRMSVTRTGKALSEEHKLKISRSEKGRVVSKQTVDKRLTTINAPYFNVYCKATGDHVGRFHNIKECARQLGLWNITVMRNLRRVFESRSYNFIYE